MQKQVLLQTAYNVEQFPRTQSIEFAIGGRSNVGKSSLINKLLNIKNLARVSSKPGKTESINFYQFNKKTLIVDFPGYGYAKRSKQTLSYWDNIIEQYLTNRDNFRLMFILIDVRRGLQTEEIDLMLFLSNLNKKFSLVFTKVDKFSNNELSKVKRDLDFELARIAGKETGFFEAFDSKFFVSSTKNTGVLDLKKRIEKWA